MPLFSISSVSIITRLNQTSELKSYCRFNLLRASVFNFERLDILRASIGYPSKCYYRLNLIRASVLNFERLDILRDSIEHPSKKLLSLEFSHSFSIQFRTSRYIMGLNGISEVKVIVV